MDALGQSDAQLCMALHTSLLSAVVFVVLMFLWAVSIVFQSNKGPKLYFPAHLNCEKPAEKDYSVFPC
jgi:hypothetical protein